MRSADPTALLDAAVAGDRAAVARLISLVERGGDAARTVAQLAYPRAGHAYSVGLTGAPGAGKSTLTSGLIGVIRAAGDEVGVLAVDPSSPFTGGAILGDRVRMQDHATDPGVFIRSMATRGHMGGLALATPEAVRLLDAVGLPVVLIETVGVGQVEIEVASAADTTVVVVTPGWGDGIQANKAGLLEAADVLVVNKADRPGAQEAVRDLELMLELHGDWAESWRPPILCTTATNGEGVAELWATVGEHRAYLERSGQLEQRRARRVADELRDIIVSRLERRAAELCAGPVYDKLRDALLARQIDPYGAAEQILDGAG